MKESFKLGVHAKASTNLIYSNNDSSESGSEKARDPEI